MHLELKDPVTRLTYFALNLMDEIEKSPADVDAEECRAMCVQLLRAFDQPGGLGETFQLAKYALTAWIDDRLSRAIWPHADSWKARPLEQELFGTSCRNWRFFEQAELALKRRDWEALVVFQFCVAFGFQGIYAKNRIKVRLNDPLPMSRTKADALTPAMTLAGMLREESSGASPARQQVTGTISSDPAKALEGQPPLPPTLEEWCQRTFGALGERSPADSRLWWKPDRMLSVKQLLKDWAIVMAVGILLTAVLFAMGR